MSNAIDFQLIFAFATVVLALVIFGYVAWSKIAAVGFLRDDYDRRAPWLALGIIIGGVVLYYVKH